MISFSAAQLDAWMAAYLFPLTRILALIAVAPFFSNAALPRRVRVLVGLAVTVAIAPALPPMPNVGAGSGAALWIMVQQLLIGLAMGFSMRLVFAGVDMAGNVIAAQMGLGFATFYDPQNTAQTAVISEFISLLALMVFLSINGHLFYFATLAQSFQAIPVTVQPLPGASWLNLAELGSKIFYIGVLLSLPAVIALIITNLALGVLNRAAPQLNLFAIGFPITLAVGFIALAVSLNYLATPLQSFFEQGLETMLTFPAPKAAPIGPS